MSGPTLPEQLYALLPAVHRARDAEAGEPLRALLAVAEEQLLALQDDVGRLYESWFIETCPEWVVPYIGDLLGARGLNALTPRTYSQRSYVANILSYRRRKGTAAMLEQLAQDLTAWPAHAVEYFEILATTQYLAHLRTANVRCEVRDAARLGRLGGPFDDVPRTAEVRRIGSGRGKFNLPNVGIHLYRLETDLVSGSLAVAAPDSPPVVPGPHPIGHQQGYYRFSPLGQDAPLWNRARDIADVTALADEASVPCALRRRALYDALEEWRKAQAASQRVPRVPDLYFGANPVVAIELNGAMLAPSDYVICNLDPWHRPPDTLPDNSPIKAAIDPLLGRLAFTDAVTATITTAPRVWFYESYAGRLGGGAYDRIDVGPTQAADLQKEMAALDPDHFPSDTVDPSPATATITGGGAALTAAIAAANGQGIIVIDDFLDYQLGDISVPAGKRLALRAGNRKRPVLRLGLSPNVTLGAGASLQLEGLLIQGGGLAVDASAGGSSLLLRHTTIVPGFALSSPDGFPFSAQSPTISCSNPDFLLQIERSILGRVQIAAARLFARDSILDGAGFTSGPVVQANRASLLACTVFGDSSFTEIDLISDCIFTGMLAIERAQQGCVRYSYLGAGSVAPPQYRCQPALAQKDAQDAAERRAIAALISPIFTSASYGQPGYGQLSQQCAVEIRTGASEQGEMGALNFLQQPQRESNLRASLDEYLRFGLEAGLFFVT
jgi:hypothetical protein